MFEVKQKKTFSVINMVDNGQCVICGCENCRQSTDHSYTSKRDLVNIINSMAQNLPQIELLKHKLSKFLCKKTRQIVEQMNIQHQKMQEKLNLCYFDHLAGQCNQSTLTLLSQIKEGNFSQIPSKRIWRQLANINKKTIIINPQRVLMSDKQSSQSIISQIEAIIANFQINPILKKIDENFLTFQQVENYGICKKNGETGFEEIKNQGQQVLQWKKLKIRKIIKNISLSCKKLTDNQLIFYGAKLEIFPNISEIDMRKNSLTHLSCSIFVNYLPQLTLLDLRSNNIGDQGVKKLKQLNKLKQLLVDDNEISDDGIQHVFQGFPNLQILWIDQNTVTQKGILKLCGKSVLKILSALNNPIDKNSLTDIKDKFSRKGLFYY